MRISSIVNWSHGATHSYTANRRPEATAVLCYVYKCTIRVCVDCLSQLLQNMVNIVFFSRCSLLFANRKSKGVIAMRCNTNENNVHVCNAPTAHHAATEYKNSFWKRRICSTLMSFTNKEIRMKLLLRRLRRLRRVWLFNSKTIFIIYVHARRPLASAQRRKMQHNNSCIDCISGVNCFAVECQESVRIVHIIHGPNCKIDRETSDLTVCKWANCPAKSRIILFYWLRSLTLIWDESKIFVMFVVDDACTRCRNYDAERAQIHEPAAMPILWWSHPRHFLKRNFMKTKKRINWLNRCTTTNDACICHNYHYHLSLLGHE